MLISAWSSGLVLFRSPERNSMMIARICFAVGSFYYLPQYLPVYDELRARCVDCSFVFYDDPIYGELLRGVVAREQLPATWCANREVSLRHYRQQIGRAHV